MSVGAFRVNLRALQPPDTTHAAMVTTRELLSATADRAIDYLESLPERPVRADPAALERLTGFVEPLPDHGRDALAVIGKLDALGTAASVAMAGPRYFGFVIGGSLPASLAASWLSSAWDQNTGMYEVTPATAILEMQSLAWLLELLDLPRDCAGSFVTGATMANCTALAAARHSVLAAAGWDVEADGLAGAPPISILISDESHPSVYKSLGLLGLGRNRVTRIPTDSQGRMGADTLPSCAGPTIVITQVGNVNTGACDPIGAIRDRVGNDVWVHVDGAFGLWAAAAPRFRHLVVGLDRADSWATDAHKWLNVPYDSGVAFVRDGHALKAAMAITAAYLPSETAHRNPSDYTPELSRRARGVEIWAAISELGRTGVASMIERCCDHAQRFADGLTAAGFEVLNDVVLNQVLVAFGDDDRTRRVIAAIQRDGTCWCGVTVWQGRTAMRISVSNWSTTAADVDRSLAAILRAAKAPD
jgi:glutamate/tyrosine decarboxylase-like PLP-dependent enzyme